MQYHLDGFRPGDPAVQPAVQPEGAHAAAGDRPSEVDVLIVGCGPAGLTLAAQLAQFGDISTRIVERKAGPLEKGQADGVSCRSMEMFEAFGFAHKVRQEAYWVNQTVFWTPDPADRSRIARAGRVQDVEDGLSEMPHVILNQARVHDMYLEVMRNGPRRLAPDYGVEVLSISRDDAASPDYPVSVTLHHATGETETVATRYVVGCDGARSTVRKAIGRELRGDSANQLWGVMDILAITDFPDIRFKTVMQSAGDGTILIIPREGGHLVRIYIEQDRLAPGERASDRDITVEQLIAKAQRVFHPYSLEVKDVVWWSAYQIGQRLTDKFDDVPAGDEAHVAPRIFIAGDACHTHSPKAGQGMNVSMGDAFNLGWKLKAVLRGEAAPELLHSYSAERHAVAQDLIEFDRHWAQAIRETGDAEADDMPPVQRQFIRQGRYTAGVAVTYAPSVLTGPKTWQGLASRFEIGARFHSAPVLRLADAKRVELGHTVRADGRWRVFAFAPDEDPTTKDGAVARLAAALADPALSPLARHSVDGAEVDALIDLRAVLPVELGAVDITDLPPIFLPRKGRFGLQDYEKLFCPLPNPADDIYEMRGIDRAAGCLVVVRPDQHVGHVMPFDGVERLGAYFDGIFRRPPG
ncbi:FAD-dependent monooxygenase [Roseicyclus amphidinii]|uniref:FAD-dependent monooxygenase n=1 Tax=Roseicyclus amphidinii TaxID=3034232 RepID=UPI0024E14F93|nr:FAD-dependent monooxygenase [Roseicyclus sp. Amp-Y-6]